MDRAAGTISASEARDVGGWAQVPLTNGQRLTIAAVALACVGGLAAAPVTTAEIVVGAVIVLASGHMIFRTILWLAGVWPARRVEPQRCDADLPIYSIIVPLYREANMAAGLAAALGRIDYPSDRLDILVALEANDGETAQAFEALRLPPHWRILTVPDGAPRTKPRACNHALAFARGAFVAIYDAEDRPEPRQLREAVAAFDAGGENLACIQARLFPYNANENVLTRLFALDFCQWFDAMLTGLQRLGFPVPLGGTSNHFRAAILRKVGAWDPWNVTEDADLGIRLGRYGYAVGTFGSTTWEEAPVTFSAWLPQRTRWARGYIQTFFVHARSARRLGLPPLGVPLAAGLMVAGNLLSVLMTVLGPIRRRAWGLMPWGLLAPVYWAMISMAAWRAVVIFTRDPFRWEKTPHGLTREPPA